MAIVIPSLPCLQDSVQCSQAAERIIAALYCGDAATGRLPRLRTAANLNTSSKTGTLHQSAICRASKRVGAAVQRRQRPPSSQMTRSPLRRRVHPSATCVHV